LCLSHFVLLSLLRSVEHIPFEVCEAVLMSVLPVLSELSEIHQVRADHFVLSQAQFASAQFAIPMIISNTSHRTLDHFLLFH